MVCALPVSATMNWKVINSVRRRLTNVAADKHFRMRFRRNGDSVLAAELRR